MPDLIIKPAAQSGNKVIIQDQAGGAVITTADSGATIANATLTSPTLNSPTLVTPALGTVATGNLSNTAIVYPTGHIVKYETSGAITPVAAQGTDTSYTDLTGSSKSYTPATGASYVVYEYTAHFSGNDVTDPRLIFLFWFYYNGSVVANTNTTLDVHGALGGFAFNYKTFRYILPAWSGSAKTMSVKYRVFSSSYEGLIHVAQHSGEGTGSDVFVKIYQNTYSIM